MRVHTLLYLHCLFVTAFSLPVRIWSEQKQVLNVGSVNDTILLGGINVLDVLQELIEFKQDSQTELSILKAQVNGGTIGTTTATTTATTTLTTPVILEQKLLAEDGATGDQFGVSVAISGTSVVVGAYRDDDKGSDSGSVYVFERNSSTGEYTQTQKLVAEDGASSDRFGYSVGIDGTTVVVGAYLDDDKGSDSGSAYVYSV
jgi:hypothetical protein